MQMKDNMKSARPDGIRAYLEPAKSLETTLARATLVQ